jgi:hypothetical protein
MVTASASGVTSAVQTETINPAAPSRLAFTSTAQTVSAGACSAAATVRSQDAYGNASNVTSATTVSLSSTSGTMTFYADSTCATAVTNRTIPAGTNAFSFYFEDTTAGSPTLTASAGGFTSAVQTETIQ